jgi:hypothetical protein
MNRVFVLKNCLQAATALRQTLSPAGIRRAYRVVGDLHAQTIEEAGSNAAVLAVLTTASDEEKAQAASELGWTPNPQNVQLLLQIAEQMMVMMAASKGVPA